MVWPPAKRVGALPPTVTVTVSMDCLPLAAVITSSPQSAWLVPAGTLLCCCAHAGTVSGTVPVMVVSLQLTFVSAAPPTVTLGQLPVAGQVEGLDPKP